MATSVSLGYGHKYSLAGPITAWVVVIKLHHASPHQILMSTSPRGILAIWHDLDPTRIEDFSAWHTQEHMPERLAVPGFLLGVRYEAVDSTPLVFNYYLTESPATLSSAAYLDRLNDPTVWTANMMPAFCNVYRAAGSEAATSGAELGSAIATLRFNTTPDGRQAFESWFVRQAMPQLLGQPNINRAHLWQADNTASAIETKESTARGGNQAVREWTIAVEGADVASAETAAKWLQQQPEFSVSLEEAPLVGCYRLVHWLEAGSLDDPNKGAINRNESS